MPWDREMQKWQVVFEFYFRMNPKHLSLYELIFTGLKKV
jgi:hypothetical protein